MQADLDLMAADLLFTETTRTRQTLREQLRQLRLAESNAVAEGRANDLKQAWIGLAGVALLFAWALFRSTRWPSTAFRARSPPSHSDTERVSLNVPPPRSADPAIDLREAAARCARRSAGCKPNPICSDYWRDGDLARRIRRCRLDGGW